MALALESSPRTRSEVGGRPSARCGDASTSEDLLAAEEAHVEVAGSNARQLLKQVAPSLGAMDIPLDLSERF
jgi:hypothetical protein